jgi:hypothetical protein
MNSSAKQIPPSAVSAKSLARGHFFLFGRALPDVLENHPEPTASGSEYAVNAMD